MLAAHHHADVTPRWFVIGRSWPRSRDRALPIARISTAADTGASDQRSGARGTRSADRSALRVFLQARRRRAREAAQPFGRALRIADGVGTRLASYRADAPDRRPHGGNGQ